MAQHANHTPAPAMDITDRASLERAIANTYSPRSGTGWERVEEYRRAMAYLDDHAADDPSAYQVGKELDIPRHRIHQWMDDQRPDPVRAIQTCAERGWLDLDWLEAPFTGLNVLVAWTFSGGSVNKTYTPYWSHRERGHTPLEMAFYEADVSVTTTRTEHHERVAEYRPDEAASALGRLLVALGAPQGSKADQELSLPPYLDEAPYLTRLDFARAYVYQRAIDVSEERPTTPLKIKEQRQGNYIQDLGGFFRDLAVDPEQVVVTDADSFFLRPPAAGLFAADPLFGSWL